MITNSGVVVDPGMDTVPTPKDIAVAMCRITRYAGSMWCPLSVHSILVAEMAFQRTKDPSDWAYGLIHDVHEIITGEIVRAWKPPEMKTRENELDNRIFPSFGLSRSDFAERASVIRYADEKALCLEATILGLPGWRNYYVSVNQREPIKTTPWDVSFANRLFQSDWMEPESIRMGSSAMITLTSAFLGVQTGFYEQARTMLSGPIIARMADVKQETIS